MKLGYVVLFFLFLAAATSLPAQNGLAYGHITLCDDHVLVKRAAMSEAENGRLNLPLVAGDTITTPAEGRCEVQFDNGTILRLDKNTTLRIETVLTPSLTSSWKITTLRLESGQVYTLSRSYRREMFQIMTPAATVAMKSGAESITCARSSGESAVAVLSGKVDVMYGDDRKSMREKTVKSSATVLIDGAGLRQSPVGADADFLEWNHGVNRDFVALHKGAAVLPKPILRHSPALQHWAMNWSTRFGVWEWNDQFGYVWKPADERFKHDRPFWNASYISVNGTFYVVPEEPWAWWPANFGTWRWDDDDGWVWMPGSSFRNTFAPYHCSYTNLLLPWGFGVYPPLYSLWCFTYSNENMGDVFKGRRIVKNEIQLPGGGPLAETAHTGANKNAVMRRDFNPDYRWAERTKFEISYNPARNEMYCPQLKLGSSSANAITRMELKSLAQVKSEIASHGRGYTNSPAAPGPSGGGGGKADSGIASRNGEK